MGVGGSLPKVPPPEVPLPEVPLPEVPLSQPDLSLPEVEREMWTSGGAASGLIAADEESMVGMSGGGRLRAGEKQGDIIRVSEDGDKGGCNVPVKLQEGGRQR